MKKLIFYIQRGGILLLVAILVAALIQWGGRLSPGAAEPLPAAAAQPIYPEGQSATVRDPQSAEETPEGIGDGSAEQTPEPPQEQEQPPEETPDSSTEPGETTDPDTPQTPGDSGREDPSSSEDTSTRLITDLSSREITFDQLTDDTLTFYAYLRNANGETLKVKLKNSTTGQNGKYLTPDETNYTARLVRNETNYFTVYRKKDGKTVREYSFAIRYVAQKADKDHPTIGEHPPTITTNLQNVSRTSNRKFTFVLQAVAYTGKNLTASQIEVLMDGKAVSAPTGGPKYEYQLYFPDPVRGNSEKHTITVRAWDEEGNSTYISYEITYDFVDTGDDIGTAYIIIDATTVGLGLMEAPYTCTVRQNVPASYAVMEMLEANDYEYDYSGSPDEGFYLQRIRRGGMMDAPEIPEDLWEKIQQDGIGLTNQHDPDSLGEYDFTKGSGWMYSVGGTAYAGKGLSEYYLSDGDILYLRFTLAYGKDIGGYSAAGGNYGLLKSYCGRWINGEYIEEHAWGDPVPTESGDLEYTCTVCGAVKSVPAAAQRTAALPNRRKP